MAGEKLLDNPYLQAKYAKLLRPHVHTEELMDRWHNEPSSAHDEASEPRGADAGALESKEKPDAKTKRRPRNRRRRKERDRKKDQPSKARGEAARPSGSNGHVDVQGGETDTYGWIYQGLEEEEVKDDDKSNA
jgi:hypothetical protein